MEKIKEKIRKLLELASSDNENESKSAMLKARELLAKHKLDISDIKEDSQAGVLPTDITYKTAKWKPILIKLIANNFLCEALSQSQGGTNRIILIGKKDDITIALEIINHAIEFIEKRTKKMGRELRKEGKSAKGLQNDYAMGFTTGLRILFEEQDRNNQQWGLVMKRSKEVQDAIEKLSSGEKELKLNRKKHHEAYGKGVEDGINFDTSKMIK